MYQKTDTCGSSSVEPPYSPPADAPGAAWPILSDLPGPPSRIVPRDIDRRGLWIIEWDEEGDVTLIWDAPMPALLQ